MPLVARVDPLTPMKRSNKTAGAPANTHSDERNGAMVLAGAELYDALYATGYHANGNTSRAHELIEYLTTTNVSIVHGVTSVLDVGCSHGFAVEKLWSAGFVASGVDISSLAVAKAREVRGEPKDRCRTPCFAVGNASALPWERNAFDAIMSSDVLEHVEPVDVDSAVRELSRVAAKLLVLRISMRSDNVDGRQVKLFNEAKHTQELRNNASVSSITPLQGDLPQNLHPSVHGPSWWTGKFKALGGWQLLRHFPVPRDAHGHPKFYACCSIALYRPAPPPVARRLSSERRERLQISVAREPV